MTALTKVAFLVALPLGAAWYLWHGHSIVAAALMAAAFAFIIGTNIRSDVRRKQAEANLHEQAKSDGRNAAELMEVSQPTASTDGPRAASEIGRAFRRLVGADCARA
jgi:hypothetical protein